MTRMVRFTAKDCFLLLLILQLYLIAEKNMLIAAYRYDKSSRNPQRTKKLTLQDVNW